MTKKDLVNLITRVDIKSLRNLQDDSLDIEFQKLKDKLYFEGITKLGLDDNKELRIYFEEYIDDII